MPRMFLPRAEQKRLQEEDQERAPAVANEVQPGPAEADDIELGDVASDAAGTE